MPVLMCPLPQQSRAPFPLCIPTQSCLVQCNLSESAHAFGLKEFCFFERLWSVLRIWLRSELPSSKTLQCFSLFIETDSPTDNWRNSGWSDVPANFEEYFKFDLLLSMKGYIVWHRILSETVLSFVFMSELVKKVLQVPREETCSALGKLMRGGSGRASWQWAGRMDIPWSKGWLKSRFHLDLNCKYVSATLHQGPTLVLLSLGKNQLNNELGLELKTNPVFLWNITVSSEAGQFLQQCLFLGSSAQFLDPRASGKPGEAFRCAEHRFLAGQLLRYNLRGACMTVSHSGLVAWNGRLFFTLTIELVLQPICTAYQVILTWLTMHNKY